MLTTLTDPYSVLGVERGATPEQVKRAFRQAAKRTHPDLHPGPNAVARMAEVNRAYELLADPARRAAWDAAHPVAVPPRPAPRPAAPTPPGAGPRPHGHGAGEPTLDAALGFVLTFGKHRGRTLGYVAAVEPGYVAWLSRSVHNRPVVMRHAHVVRRHLETGGWRDTPRPARPAAGHTNAAPNPATGAGARPRPGPSPAPPRSPGPATSSRPAADRPARRRLLDDPVEAFVIGLMVLSGVAWFVGLPPGTISGLTFIAVFVTWPISAVIQSRRLPPAGPKLTGFQAWRRAAGQVVLVAVLLGIGWSVVQGMFREPQPGDIVCEAYDPRVGDCVVESVVEGE